MMTRHGGPLKWVQANRRRLDSHQTIGSLLHGVVRSATDARGEIAERVGEVVDDEFARAARIGRVERGTLVVLVENNALASEFHRRWRAVLSNELQRMAPTLRIRDVRFEVGGGGIPIDGRRNLQTI